MVDCVTYVTPIKLPHLLFYLTKSIIYATDIVTTVIRQIVVANNNSAPNLCVLLGTHAGKITLYFLRVRAC